MDFPEPTPQEIADLSDDERRVWERLKQLKPRLEEWTKKTDEPFNLEVFRARMAEIRAVLQEIESIGDAEHKANLREAIELLESFDDLFNPVAWQRKYIKLVLEKIPETASQESIERASTAFRALGERERRQALYMQRLVLTDDAFGIVVRGHVLIESALQACIYAYVPHPVDLHRKLGMFFAHKIRLAHMLGLIDEHERAILVDFNELRNQLAHFGKGVQNLAPDFHITPEQERTLWEKFASNPSMDGDWPEYDRSKFPLYLRYVVMYLYLRLNNRSERLASKRLTPVVQEVAPGAVDKMVLPYTAMLMVNILTSIGESLDGDTHVFESEAAVPSQNDAPE